MIDSIQQFFTYLSNSEAILRNGGLLLMMVIIFAETGLFVGFFLPGDYLLFLSGLFSGTGAFPIHLYVLLPCIMLAAFLGNTAGYLTGRYFGHRLFKKDDSLIFKKKYLERTRAFYEKRGNSMVLVARFLPIIRTFAPILAGAIDMPFKKFSLLNLAGAVLWVGLLIPVGYYLGSSHPGIIHYVHYFIIGFIVITAIPLVWAWLSGKGKKDPGNKK